MRRMRVCAILPAERGRLEGNWTGRSAGLRAGSCRGWRADMVAGFLLQERSPSPLSLRDVLGKLQLHVQSTVQLHIPCMAVSGGKAAAG